MASSSGYDSVLASARAERERLRQEDEARRRQATLEERRKRDEEARRKGACVVRPRQGPLAVCTSWDVRDVGWDGA